MSKYTDIIEDIKSRGAYSLSADAECGSPDSRESEGAQMLERVRDGVFELAERVDWTSDQWDNADYDGSLGEIADGAPSIYTSTKWQQFVDLQAYEEDPTDLGCDGSDMDQAAGVCLYIIAGRLVYALVTEITDAVREDEEEAEDYLGTCECGAEFTDPEEFDNHITSH